ncbi:MAG: NADH:ubiquinone reductase (Na(+)-transporting) subunit D [Thermoguttaceae bacterium]|jgi:Na+-transporting NADH:ubiquinone oxidoreductase subunit D|nr:NADH:ubiquinone reductase (Na(+)-transporting) subunit D [Thermoguttaceae bacterium]MBR5160386.1 NADH:ubiquinone reductase (Na(+)-transporting) subunit D [Thermoguttaceae bacterium]MBR6435466.1 NADH:ubiquinone reductase (Na(+)-transporting) subunit D [Thermoguttaceae bacterium]
MATAKEYKEAFLSPLFATNPIALSVLGICSALAVTTKMDTALTMTIAVTSVLVCSNFAVSLIRNHIPSSIRMIVQMVIIAAMVMIVDLVLQAFAFKLSKSLSVFVSLIITNCIIMGRAEAFAMKNPPLLSIVDGLGNGFGYGLILMIVSFFREFFGSGTIFGFEVLKTVNNGGWYMPNGLMILAPSAFFIIGLIIWLFKTINPKLQEGEK